MKFIAIAIIFISISITQSLNIVNEEDFKNACNNGTIPSIFCNAIVGCSGNSYYLFIAGWTIAALLTAIIVIILFIKCCCRTCC